MRKRTVAERLNIGDNASPGTEVEVVWATDEKRGRRAMEMKAQ